MIFVGNKLGYTRQNRQKREFTIRYISKMKNSGDNYMENKQVKVYLGIRRVCAADNVNCPNQATFYLSDTIEKLIIIVNKILPFREWKCYLGRCGKNVRDVEDGILVWGRTDSRVLISVSYEYERDKDTCKKIRTIVKKDNDWHEKMEVHPYLYFI